MERSIDGPPWERGDKEKVFQWLGIRESALDAYIKAGQFPPGSGPNKANLTWHWQEVVAFSWLLAHLTKMRPQTATEEEKNVGPT